MESRSALGVLNCGLLSSDIPGVIGKEKGRFKINVSGAKFELSRQNIIRYPATRLAKIVQGRRSSCYKDSTAVPLYDDYDRDIDEYFFGRNPSCFPLVISFYVGGVLHIPRHICVDLFQEEMEYWGINFIPDYCCQGYHQQEWEINETVRKTNDLFESRHNRRVVSNGNHMGSVMNLGPVSRATVWKQKLWDLFESNDSSRAASVSSLFFQCLGSEHLEF